MRYTQPNQTKPNQTKSVKPGFHCRVKEIGKSYWDWKAYKKSDNLIKRIKDSSYMERFIEIRMNSFTKKENESWCNWTFQNDWDF